MRARFRGEAGGDSVCVVFGQEFPVGEWVQTPSAKLATNPMFEVDIDGDDEPDPTVDELRADLDQLGVAYHPRAGVAKLKALLEQATAPEA